MARKKNKVDGKIDLSSDLDFDDFNFEDPTITDDRKPIVRAATAAAKGAFKAPRDSAFLKRTLKNTLPRGFGDSIDNADRVTESVKNLYDESVKDIKPAIKESKKALSKLIPRDSKLVPKSVSKLLDKWDQQAKDEAAYASGSADQHREESILAGVGDVFRAQMEQNQIHHAESEGRDRLKEGIEMSRHREISDILLRSSISLDKMQQYQTNVTLGYQKKSLELQFRQLFATQDLLAFAKEDAQKRDALLLAVSKNTSLPDAVKINSKEAREALARQRLNTAVQRGLFGGRDAYIEKLLGGVSGVVGGKVKELSGGLVQGLSMANDAGEMTAGMDRYALAGEEIGGAAARGAGSWIAGKAKNALNSNRLDRFGGKKVLQAGHRLENLNENLPQRIDAFRKSDKYTFDDSLKGGAMRLLQGLIPSMGPDMSIKTIGAKELDQGTTVTHRTNRSLTQVIPGYLARILRELQVTRTGNTKIELTEFNYAAGKFTSKGKLEASMMKDIINGNSAKRTNRDLDQMLKQIDPEGKLSKEATAELKKKLLSNSADFGEANKENLGMYASYQGVKDDLVDEIVPAMRQFFDNLSDEQRTTFSRNNNSLAKSIGDPREAIQRQADAGNIAFLKRAGLVDKDGENINMAKVIDYVLDPKNQVEVQAMVNNPMGGRDAGGAAFQGMARHLAPKTTMKERAQAAMQQGLSMAGNAMNSVKGNAQKLAAMTPEEILKASRDNALHAVELVKTNETLAKAKGLGQEGMEAVQNSSAFQSMSSALTKASQSAASELAVAKFNQAKAAVMDVYVAGERNPRIIAAKLQAGAYRDRVTHEVITRLDQIKGPIEDTLDNNNLVLEAKDLVKLVYVNPVSQTLTKLETAALGAVDSVKANVTPKNLNDIGQMLKQKGQDTFDAAKQAVTDVYVENEEVPRLLAAKIKQGLYSDAETGKPIHHQSEINGEVKDEEGKVVVAAEDMPKLRVWDVRQRRFAKIRFVGRMALGLAKGLWWLQKKNTAWAMWNVKMLGKGLSLGWKVVKRVTGIGPQAPKDVYVAGEPEPRLYAARFKAGDYRDKATGKRLRDHTEIKGEVIDRDDQTVLFDEDMPNLRIYNNILRVLNPFKVVGWISKKIGSGIAGAAKWWQTKAAPYLSGKMLSGIGKVVGAVAGWLAKPGDVYVKGATMASLKESAMRAGQYISAKTKKVIEKIRDIDGAVLDTQGNTLITEDEFTRGLVTKDGQDIKGGGIAGVLGKLNRLMSVQVKLPMKQREAASKDLLKNKAVSAADKTVILLQDIKQIFADQFGKKNVLGDTDGDGLAEGSWQAKAKKAAEAAKDKATQAAGAVKNGAKDGGAMGVLGALKGLFSKKKTDEEDEDGYGLSDGLEDLSNADDLLDRGGKSKRGRVRGKGRLGRLAGKLGGVKGIAKGAGVAALAYGAARGTNALAGGLGVGGNQLDTRKDDTNWANMSAGEKLESGLARGTEKLGSFVGFDNFANQAGAKRIENESAYLAERMKAKDAKLGLPTMDANGQPKFQFDVAASSTDKLPTVGITAASSLSASSLSVGKSVGAMDAVRYKAYGLTAMDPGKVTALASLERTMAGLIKFDGSGTANYNGNALEVLKAVQSSFSVGNLVSSEANTWTIWFKNRFLPVYLAYATGYKGITGKDDLLSASVNLKDAQQLQVAKLLVGTNVWGEKASPWGDYKLNTDSDTTKENTALLEQTAKQAALNEAKLPVKDAKSEANKGVFTRAIDAVKDFFSPSKEAAKAATKLPAIAPPDAEVQIKGTGGTSPVAVSSSAAAQIAMAGGELSDGRNAMAYLDIRGKTKLEGMNPAFMKNFYGMAEEYGKLTGKKIGINDAFRSFQDQADAKKKYGARAASPGSSLHEYGLAMDIDTKTLDEMDKMGLMRKYGFTRPVGGEGWHMEPIGIQADIAAFKKDQAAATQATQDSVGRGGGGFGTVANAPKYSRNRDYAMAIMQQSIKPNVDTAKQDGVAAIPAQAAGAAALAGGASPAQAMTQPDQSMVPTGNAGGVALGQTTDVEKKPQGAGGGSMAANGQGDSPSGINTKNASTTADPSAKVPDPTGTGYQGLKNTIEGASKLVGVDGDTMVSMAAIESGFDPSAKASGSSATGLFQFTKDTWRAMMDKYGRKYGFSAAATSPTDPKASAIMAAHMLKESAQRVGSKIKRAFGATEAYISHFLGANGATTFLKALEANPGAAAADVIPAAAKSNPSIFFQSGKSRTIGEVYSLLDNKVRTKTASFGIPSSGASDTDTMLASNSAIKADAPSASTVQVAYKPEASSAPAIAAPATNQAGSPLSDAYGFKPMETAARTAPQGQPNQLDPSLFSKSEDLLSQSVEVQKKMLEVMTNIFGLMSTNSGGAKDNMPNAAPPSSKSEGYTVPKAPVPMKRAMT